MNHQPLSSGRALAHLRETDGKPFLIAAAALARSAVGLNECATLFRSGGMIEKICKQDRLYLCVETTCGIFHGRVRISYLFKISGRLHVQRRHGYSAVNSSNNSAAVSHIDVGRKYLPPVEVAICSISDLGVEEK